MEEASARKKKRRRFKNLQRNLRYYLLMLPGLALLTRLPLPVARLLGRNLGRLVWAFAWSDRRTAMENLERAFGREKTRRELRRICRRVFQHTVENLFELLAVHRWPREKVRRVFPIGEEFASFRKRNSAGTVGITAHFGSWEMLGVLFGAFEPGYIFPVAKRVYFEKFQALVEAFRKNAGFDVIYTDESPRRMIEAIRSGYLLGLLPDQDNKALNGVFVPYFGRPAYTATMPANLARATGAVMTTCFLVRTEDGYHLRFQEIPVQRTGKREEDLLETTRRWTAALESEVRAYPDQWVWFHQRWRTQPEDGPRKIPRRRRGLRAASA